MVTRDHLDGDAGALAFGYRSDGFFAGWIDDADEPEQFKTGLDMGVLNAVDVFCCAALRQRQNTFTGLGCTLDGLVPLRNVQSLARAAYAQGQHALGGTFELYLPLALGRGVQCGHEAVLRFEWDRV